MSSYLIKKFFLLIFLFFIIFGVIYLLTSYLTKKIFNLVQEINNLIVEKETRIEKERYSFLIKNSLNQLENKYNFNFEDFKKNFYFKDPKVNNKILEFASTNKINLSFDEANLTIIFLDNLDNFLKLKDFLKQNNLTISSLSSQLINGNLKIEIKLE